jgi:hypothetical protein
VGFGVVEALRLAALRPWPDENGTYPEKLTKKLAKRRLFVVNNCQ